MLFSLKLVESSKTRLKYFNPFLQGKCFALPSFSLRCDFQAGNPKVNFQTAIMHDFFFFSTPMLLFFFFLFQFLVLFLFYLFFLLLRRFHSYFLFGRPRVHILARRPAVLPGVVLIFLRLSGKSLNSTGSYTKTGYFNIC
jgi:hypothetical protein